MAGPASASAATLNVTLSSTTATYGQPLTVTTAGSTDEQGNVDVFVCHGPLIRGHHTLLELPAPDGQAVLN